jgi:hypothetical protein
MSELRHNEYVVLLDQIAELQRRKLAHEKEKEKLYDRIRPIHAKLVLEIGTTKDEKGKLVYSNEHLREAALTLKLDEHEGFRELSEKRRTISHEVSEIVIEYNRLVEQKYLLMVEMGIPLESEQEKYLDVH